MSKGRAHRAWYQRLAKTDVLVLDDWGLETLGAEQRRDLLEILEDRHGSGATIITSHFPLDQWHVIIGDATLADAIMGRLIHNAYEINLYSLHSARQLFGFSCSQLLY